MLFTLIGLGMEDTRQPLAELTRGDWLAFDSLLLESGMANDWIAEDGAGGVLVESFTLRGDDGENTRKEGSKELGTMTTGTLQPKSCCPLERHQSRLTPVGIPHASS